MKAPPPQSPVPPLRHRWSHWFRRWRRRQTGHRFDVQAVVTALHDGRDRCKAVFTELGSQLDAIDRQSTHLLENCDALLELASGRSEGVDLFQESLRILDQPIAHVQASLTNLQPMQTAIDQCAQHAAALLECQVAMGEVLSPLRHMIVFFKIESAGLEPEHQATFLTVADEIQRLREKIDQTFDENLSQLRAVRRTIAEVRDSVVREYSRHSQTFTEKRGQIDRAVQSLGTQLERDTVRDGRLREVSQSVVGEIGRLVTALQFEDILTQRIDHLVTKLQAGPVPGTANAWLHLMSGHADSLLSDLTVNRAALDAGLQRFVSHSHELGEAAMMLRNAENSTASVDGMVQLLIEAFGEITEITVDNTRLAENSLRSLQPLREVTENLSSVVIEVSLNIHLIALNAQVRSVQLGERTGLEVLAARTAEISAELAALGDRTAHEIIALREVSQALLGQLTAMSETGHRHLSDLKSQGTSVVSRLHSMRDRTLQTLQQVCGSMETVLERTQSRVDLLSGLDAADAQLREACALLSALAERHPPDAQERRRLGAESSGYTMASERTVHAQVAGLSHPLEEHDAATTLFTNEPMAALPPIAVRRHNPAPTPKLPAQPPLATAPARESVPAAASPERSPPQPVADVQLGDNCELF